MANTFNNNYYKDRKHQAQVNNFLKSVDLKPRDLVSHPCFEDITLLQEIKRNVWNWLATKEKDYWHYYWHLVYIDKKRLNRKAFRRLSKFMENVVYRQNEFHQRQTKIKSFRQAV